MELTWSQGQWLKYLTSSIKNKRSKGNIRTIGRENRPNFNRGGSFVKVGAVYISMSDYSSVQTQNRVTHYRPMCARASIARKSGEAPRSEEQIQIVTRPVDIGHYCEERAQDYQRAAMPHKGEPLGKIEKGGLLCQRRQGLDNCE